MHKIILDLALWACFGIIVKALFEEGNFFYQSKIAVNKINAKRRTTGIIILCGITCFNTAKCSSFTYNDDTRDCVIEKTGKSEVTAGYGRWCLRERKKDRPKDTEYSEEIFMKKDPKGYTQVTKGNNTILVKFHKEPAAWIMAQRVCEEEGAYLAMPKTDGEHAIVSRFCNESIARQNVFVWIGMTAKPQGSDTYKWVDGTLVTSSRWLHGEPSNSVEDCVHLKYDVTGWGWNDNWCIHNYTYLCQFGILNVKY